MSTMMNTAQAKPIMTRPNSTRLALVQVPQGPACVCPSCETGHDRLVHGLCVACNAERWDASEDLAVLLDALDDEADGDEAALFDLDLDPRSGIPNPWS